MRIKLIKFKKLPVEFFKSFYSTFTFVTLLILYLIIKGFAKVVENKLVPYAIQKKIIPVIDTVYIFVTSRNKHDENTINRVNLIELALRNMKFKLTRTLITIGGMSVGIASIVFLVSIGFGLQQLVISRVARLDELKQADVTIQPGSNLRINDKTVTALAELKDVKHVLPQISLVARVNYKNSASDMAVYGVTSEYLKQTALKPVRGEIFESNETSYNPRPASTEVKGIETKSVNKNYGDKNLDIEFKIQPGIWLEVRKEPKLGGEIIGYTRRTEGTQTGYEVWGEPYSSNRETSKVFRSLNGNPIEKWIYSPFIMWDLGPDGKYERRNESGLYVQERGYIRIDGIVYEEIPDIKPEVLGIIDLANNFESIEGTESTIPLELAGLGDETIAAILQEINYRPPDASKNVDLPSVAKKQAVINRSALQILGIEEKDAVGSTFEASFIVTGDLLENVDENIQSNPAVYTIIGVLPQDDAPYFYVPFIDLKSLNIISYSQLKIVTNNENSLTDVRKRIEALGYQTTSVVDTISQINSFFSTVRAILALLGTVALSVAALGMFNTLTVSLLERTREIGLMKAMGMRSHEVRELFLTESMIMGLFGGVSGIVMGFLAGELISVVLSIIAISRGVGYIDVSSIPLPFVLLILSLSLFVGLVTGIYPSRRATKISALNALRYE